MKILSGWDTSGIMRGVGRKTINLKKLSAAEKTKIQEQHDRAMKEVPLWDMFGGVVNLGHRHFQVAP